MKKLLAVSAALFLLAGLVWLSGIHASNAPAPAAVAPEMRQPALEPLAPPSIPDCPATFTSCVDVPGKSCRVSTACNTTDTGERRCRQPDGSIFDCQGNERIHIQNCPCRTRLQNICCPECPEFTCGDCEGQPGSQSFFCA